MRCHTPNIKLQTTPRRAAIEYLTSLHRNPETDPIEPLRTRIDEMRADIESRLPRLSPREGPKEVERLLGRATTQTCFFIELYSIAVRDLIHTITSLMELNVFVSAFCNFASSPCPWLYEQMTGQYNSLEVRIEVVSQIETKYFCGVRVLPPSHALLTDVELNRCKALRALVAEKGTGLSSGLCDPVHCVENAHAAMERYISVIRHHTSLRQARAAGICLQQADDEMYSSYQKCGQYAELLSRRGSDKPHAGRLDYLRLEDANPPAR